MEQLKVYHLQTHRASGIGADKITKYEHILVKLSGILLLKKYCKFLPQDGILTSNPPTIKNVLINGQNAGVEEIQAAQKIVDDLLKVPEKKRNFQDAFEDQKKRNDRLEQRLEALETPEEKSVTSTFLPTRKEILQAKAKELNIVFRSNLGNEKLLSKIIEIEPEYEI